MNFLKLKTNDGCCTSQANGETSIVEWCVMDKNKIWDKLCVELNFEKYIPKYCSKNHIKKIQDIIFSKGMIKKHTKCNCQTIYLFQPLEQALVKRIEPNETKIKTIEEFIGTIDDDTHIFEFVKQNYKLPDWFIIPVWTHNKKRESAEESQKEFDEYENFTIWADDFLMKNGKRIKEPIKNPFKKQNKKDTKEVILKNNSIYSQSLYDAYKVLSNYLFYLLASGVLNITDATEAKTDLSTFVKVTVPHSLSFLPPATACDNPLDRASK